MLPSSVGPQPTRGVVGIGPGAKKPRHGGFILVATALPAANSFAHSIFCSAAMLLTPSSLKIWRAYSLDISAVGMRPPPPDCTDARWMRPTADGMPSKVVTLEPPPDWP